MDGMMEQHRVIRNVANGVTVPDEPLEVVEAILEQFWPRGFEELLNEMPGGEFVPRLAPVRAERCFADLDERDDDGVIFCDTEPHGRNLATLGFYVTGE